MKDGKHVILCVDDDQDLLDSMSTILEGNGYQVVTGNSAEEGIRKFAEVNPDLIIVDLMMEEVDSGTSFVRELKSRNVKVPIYMLSSVGDALNITTDYSELGLTGVLQKPIRPDSLLATMKAKLG